MFEVPLKSRMKGYIQYIGNDLTQLNSDVIRVFKRRDKVEAEISVDDILKDGIDFYSHVVDVQHGVKDGSWSKIGNSENLGDLKAPFFRSSRDYGDPSIKVSHKWDVWRMNETDEYVGELKGENARAEIGSVTWPKKIAERMQTGEFSNFYPDYQ